VRLADALGDADVNPRSMDKRKPAGAAALHVQSYPPV
jgi:hypothetical protein